MSEQTSLPVIAGTDAKAAQHNAVVNDLGRLFNGEIPLFDRSSQVFGGPPPISPGLFKIQGGTHVQVTNGSGGGGLSFPTPFPNGVLTIVAVEGDNTMPGVLAILQGQVTLDHFGFQFQNSGSGIVRLNWIAIGW